MPRKPGLIIKTQEKVGTETKEAAQDRGYRLIHWVSPAAAYRQANNKQMEKTHFRGGINIQHCYNLLSKILSSY